LASGRTYITSLPSRAPSPKSPLSSLHSASAVRRDRDEHLPIKVKEAARGVLAKRGVILLDCPLSGTVRRPASRTCSST